MIRACCECRKWYDVNAKEWINPSSEDIMRYTGSGTITHGYCEPCFINVMEREGVSKEDINKGLVELLKWTKDMEKNYIVYG